MSATLEFLACLILTEYFPSKNPILHNSYSASFLQLLLLGGIHWFLPFSQPKNTGMIKIPFWSLFLLCYFHSNLVKINSIHINSNTFQILEIPKFMSPVQTLILSLKLRQPIAGCHLQLENSSKMESSIPSLIPTPSHRPDPHPVKSPDLGK